MPTRTSDASKELRTYPTRWVGQPLLVCSKCERKLKRSNSHPKLKKLKKSLKALAKKDLFPAFVHVISVPCMKLCPKGGVTVCTLTQLNQSPPSLSILRSKQDIAALYREYKSAQREYESAQVFIDETATH